MAVDVTTGKFRNVPPVANFAALPASGNQSGDVRLALNTLAQYVWNGSLWMPQSELDLSRATQNYEDFESDVITTPQYGMPWSTALGGTGAAVSVITTNIDSNHFGLRQLSTGTTAAGSCGFYMSVQERAIGGSIMYAETMVRFPTLSAGGQRYLFRWGLGNVWNNVVLAGNGLYFDYDAATSANWLAANYNGTSTIADSGTVVNANTWYKLGILYISSGTTGCTYFINGTQVTGTPITSNLPTAVLIGWGYRMLKTQGTTARTAIIDYFLQRTRLSNQR